MTWLVNPYRFGAAAAPSGTHSYWMVATIGTGDGAINLDRPRIAEIEMASTAAGSNLCSGGTPSANLGATASLFFDGNNSTFSYPTTGDTIDQLQVTYEFATPTSVREVRIRAATGGDSLSAPTGLAVLGSDDGATWYLYAVHPTTSTAYTSGEIKSFAVAGTPLPTGLGRTNARAWGITVTAANGGGSYGLWEMQGATSSGGSDILAAAGGTLFSSSLSGLGYHATRVFDGNTATEWSSVGAAVVSRIGRILDTPSDLYEMRLSAQGPAAIKDFTIWYTEDFLTYTTVSTITAQTGWTAGAYRTFVL